MSLTTVKYQLLNTANYILNITKMNHFNYDELAYYHKDNFPDLEISRPNSNTDLQLLDTRSIVTINGLIYPTIYSGNRLYVPNATLNVLKSRKNNVGILSFNKLAVELKKHVIVPSMISSETPVSLFEKTILTFSSEIKHPILVIAGYPVFEHPEFFYRVSGNSFALRLDRLNYVERLYELSRYRNIFVDLNIPTSDNNPYLIDGGVARSNEVITNFLTTYNSFLIELDCSTFTTTKIYLEHSNIPGSFRTEIEPTYPIVAGYGKFTEYVKHRNNDHKYTVHIADPYYNNHLFSKLSTHQINLYNDHRNPNSTYNLSQAFFLKMEVS